MSEETLPPTEPADPLAPTDANPDPSPETEATTEAEAAAKKQPWYQKRFDDLAAEKWEARRERDHWRELALRGQQGQQPAETQVQQSVVPQGRPVAPKLSDFDNDYDAYDVARDAYTERLTDWKVGEALGRVEQTRQAETAAQQRDREQREFDERATAFAKTTPDFVEKVLRPETLPFSQTMFDVIRKHPNGPALALELVNNPTEALRIATLSPLDAAIEMGPMLAAIAPPARRNVNLAPAPINALAGGGAGAATDPSKLTADEWRKVRDAEIRAKRNG